jgi:sec-independent protein translocase protein TatA
MVGDILQPTHLVFVLVVALLVLGPKKLPEVGRQLGNGLRDFRAAINGEHREHEEVEAPYEETASDTTVGHEFAHEPSVEATSDGHEFAHEPSVEATSDGHEFAHESEPAAGVHDTEHGEKPDGGHEFAYETSDSSDKRTDPLA